VSGWSVPTPAAPAAAPVAAPTLQVEGLSVRFGGHLAVSDVSLAVRPGRISGLIGPNGAGKTTTFNAICGVTTPTAGRVLLEGDDVSRLSTHQRARRGIGRTFQRLEVFSSLTVADNVRVGQEIRAGWARRRRPAPQFLAAGAGADPERIGADAEVGLIVDRLGLGPVADVPVGSLPTGQARKVELGRALAARPRVLLLDEPASGLDDLETEDLGRLLGDLAAAGLGVLLVEHDVALVMRVCADLSVLNFGQLIATGTPDEVQSNRAVLDAYLGGEADEAAAAAAATAAGVDVGPVDPGALR
jgi:branched-chain amino acid transport system ATP-binding protein